MGLWWCLVHLIVFIYLFFILGRCANLFGTISAYNLQGKNSLNKLKKTDHLEAEEGVFLASAF